MSRDTFITAPNVLSLSRLGLAAAFVVIGDPAQRLLVLLLAAATDVLDGWLARRANATTRWGALLDPITDRIFVFAAVCVFLVERQLTTVQYVVLIFRDVMTAIGFLVAKSVSWLRPITFRARAAGKLVTALQLATLIAVLIRPDLVPSLIIVVAVTAVIAVIDYTLLLWRERSRTPA
ncbi:MAG: CDP-alcohol phosphatidyltransferase family protein [Gemmatimonadaceae bacterium]|nr:CDP-alcohol phosphatidyltransferase family protein [Gemmatimonadaceae bacterium]